MRQEPSQISGCLLRWKNENQGWHQHKWLWPAHAEEKPTHKLLIFAHESLDEATRKHKVIDLLRRTRKDGIHYSFREMLASLPTSTRSRLPPRCCLLCYSRRSMSKASSFRKVFHGTG